MYDNYYPISKLVDEIGERSKDMGPVVQSVVSLTSSLRVISLTVLADFCIAKATHIFSAKNFSIFAYHSM